ncbi:hypothetical protein RF11_13999 [Thelohanellus kitauei]|uniref:Uncharacterized protein n=1 Tax=Thelohanellus kitauei TaxID=669202 RepID=A0A0C2JXD3_THEKT|nr:hypothetical protein RF11_13999 [Thelohanellus kitauei]
MGTPLYISGICEVIVHLINVRQNLSLGEMSLNNTLIYGMNWFWSFAVHLSLSYYTDIGNYQIFSFNTNFGDIIRSYPKLPSNVIGTINGIQVILNLKPYSIPKCVRHTQVPFTLNEKFEDDFNPLYRQDIIELVNFASLTLYLVHHLLYS